MSDEKLKAIMAALYVLCLANGAEIVMLWKVMAQ